MCWAQWSWWAPKPLVWLHERFGISESDAVPAVGGCRPLGRTAPSRRQDSGAHPPRVRRHAYCRDGHRQWLTRQPTIFAVVVRRAGPAICCATKSWTPLPTSCWKPGTPKRCRFARWQQRVGVTPPSIYLHFEDKDSPARRGVRPLLREAGRRDAAGVRSAAAAMSRCCEPRDWPISGSPPETPELYRIATMGEWRSGSDVDAALASSAFAHMRATVQALMDEGSLPARRCGDRCPGAVECRARRGRRC